ncbi:hypothetical protein [Qipengyuania thermophila]|uniref:hypothetical protein n=1 Tax=Qipengyuania thermophila TaxID=2509361 RepID=UPI0018F87166|nr:hypothetical protein [Qipengyuania thermophila]
MAMPKTQVRRPGRRRVMWLVVAAVLLAGVAAAAVFGPALRGYAAAGTAYAARVTCSCRFVAGRSLADCAKDKVAGMEWVRLSEDTERRSVTAVFPLLGSDEAAFEPGWGCVLRPWQG